MGRFMLVHMSITGSTAVAFCARSAINCCGIQKDGMNINQRNKFCDEVHKTQMRGVLNSSHSG